MSANEVVYKRRSLDPKRGGVGGVKDYSVPHRGDFSTLSDKQMATINAMLIQRASATRFSVIFHVCYICKLFYSIDVIFF